jgi:hypothetical protein
MLERLHTIIQTGDSIKILSVAIKCLKQQHRTMYVEPPGIVSYSPLLPARFLPSAGFIVAEQYHRTYIILVMNLNKITDQFECDDWDNATKLSCNWGLDDFVAARRYKSLELDVYIQALHTYDAMYVNCILTPSRGCQ